MAKPTTPSVNLFPFLAVLVCTMGALILLLLVTTRRIRQQALAPPVVEVAETEAVELTPLLVIEESPEQDPDDKPLSPWLAFDPPPIEVPEPQVDWQAERRQRRAEYEAELAKRNAEQQAINDMWSSRLAEVMQQSRELEAQLESKRDRISSTQQEAESTQKEVDRLTQQLATAMTEKASILNKLDEVEAQQKNITTEFESLQTEFARISESENEKEIEFEVVGFRGNSRTRRRPILVECRADGISFAVEGVTLTPDQLSGFTSAHNPLRAGAQALAEYWTRVERLEESNTKPYILLLVRPGGTVAFYIARQMFEKMDEEFGYELIPHQQPLKWADPDPQAVALCETAVEAILNERERLASRLRSGRLPVAGSLMFEGHDGNFHLQEVDQLRNAGDSLGTGNEKWQSPTARNRSKQFNAQESARLFGAAEGPHSRGLGNQEGQFGNKEMANGGNTNPFEDNAASTPPGMTDQPGEFSSTSSGNPFPKLEKLPSFEELVEQQRDTNGVTGKYESANGGRDLSSEHPRTKLTPADSGTLAQSFQEELRQQQLRNAQGSGSMSSGSQTAGQGSASVSLPNSQSGGQRAPVGSAQAADAPLESWVPKTPQATIGIEREIKIHVRKDSIQIDDLPRIQMPLNQTPEALRDQFAQYLLRHITSWDRAPNSFFWRPYLKYEIHPGGNVPYARLKPITDGWKAKTKTAYVLEE